MQLLNWQQDFINSKKICLWCSTGMGKSRVGGHILSQKSSGLIICPPHLIKEWVVIGKENGVEITELLPADKKLNLTGSGFYVVSINKVALYEIKILKQFDVLILDEAHRFKNHKSQSWKKTIKIADFFKDKYAMTATFVTQNDCDLIAPALICSDELRRKYDGSYYKFLKSGNCTFKEQFIKTIMIAGIMKNSVEVETGLTKKGKEELLKHFYITDYETAGMIKPDFSIKKVEFEITKEHTKTLDEEEFPAEEEINDLEFKFSDLHQVINCFSYKTDKTFSINEKLDTLKSIIDNENGKGLVFYYFKANQSILGQLKGFKEYNGYESIEEFEDSDNKVMFANYKSIGEGIRFKKCDFIVEFDLIFDYAAILQSRGRLQYANRKDPFKIYRLIPNHNQVKLVESNIDNKQKQINEYDKYKVKVENINEIKEVKVENINEIKEVKKVRSFWDMI
jgi:hypothetical protein